jgi:chemotaxis protein histidine kinase CheA
MAADDELMAAVIRIQVGVRSMIARKRVVERLRMVFDGKAKEVPPDIQSALDSCWAEYETHSALQERSWAEQFDKDHQRYYYYCVEDGQVVWDKPADYIMHAEYSEMLAAVRIQHHYRAKRSHDAAMEMLRIEEEGGNVEEFIRMKAEKRAEEMKAKAALGMSSALDQAQIAMAHMNEQEEMMKRELAALKRRKEAERIAEREREKREKERLRKAREEIERKKREAEEKEKERKQKEKEEELRAHWTKEQKAKADAKRALMAQLKEEKEAADRVKAERKRAIDERLKREKEERNRLNRERKEEIKRRRENEIKDWTKKYKEEVEECEAQYQRLTERDAKKLRAIQVLKEERAKEVMRRELLHEKSYYNPFEACAEGPCTIRRFQALYEEMAKRHNARNAESPSRAGCARWDVNGRNEATGETLLHVASWHGRNEIVKWLLNKGADPNIIDSTNGRTTPLMHAARQGHRDVVRTLIAAGGNVLLVDAMGDTPLHMAARHNYLGTCRALMEGDRKLLTIQMRNLKGRRPIDHATRNCVRRLLGAYEFEGRDLVIPPILWKISAKDKRDARERERKARLAKERKRQMKKQSLQRKTKLKKAARSVQKASMLQRRMKIMGMLKGKKQKKKKGNQDRK